jgi:uncharacterized membrane protein
MFSLPRFERAGRLVPGTSLVRVPFTMAAGVVVLLVATVTLDVFIDARMAPALRWLSVGNIDDARAILGAVLGAVSTVLALIFSVSLLVFSMASSQLGPRMMSYFMRNRTMQVTLGLFLATFLHSFVTFIITGERGGEVFVPQITVLCSVALVLVSFGYLVIYNNRVAQAIQTNDALPRIVENLHVAISELETMRRNTSAPPPEEEGEEVGLLKDRCISEGRLVVANTSGYIQRINYRRLVRIAESHGIIVYFPITAGEFILEAEPLAYILPASQREDLPESIQASVDIGQLRTLEQDIEFAFAQLLEIAIRALSPAINDTYTALSCIDWLSDAFRMLSALPRTDGTWRTRDGTIRLIRRRVRVPQLVRTAFDMIREAGATSPAVATRLLQTFSRLAPIANTDDERAALLVQVEAVWQAASRNPEVSLDHATIAAAYHEAQSRLSALDAATSV